MSTNNLYVGLDIGTSGVRAVIIDDQTNTIAQAHKALVDNLRSPANWWETVCSVLLDISTQIDTKNVVALSVDGTSGTMLPIDKDGNPLADGLMYNDVCSNQDILDKINACAPESSTAKGATSALARVLLFSDTKAYKIVHQADWIAGKLTNTWVSDENNALKTGYDLQSQQWPDWIKDTGVDLALLPEVFEPGQKVAKVTEQVVTKLGLHPDIDVVAGTTDGCASFLATGANQPGDGVSAIGTSLTIKMLSDKQISAPQYGIYSHRVLGSWLAGGASNVGGAVLLAHFSKDQIEELSNQIDPDVECELDYYPLVKPGERFPIADPNLPPRLTPRPDDDVEFLKGILDGIAKVEALAYSRLEELGAPKLKTLRSVGGGAKNPIWTKMRKLRTPVIFEKPLSTQAAYGTALLARHGSVTK